MTMEELNKQLDALRRRLAKLESEVIISAPELGGTKIVNLTMTPKDAIKYGLEDKEKS